MKNFGPILPVAAEGFMANTNVLVEANYFHHHSSWGHQSVLQQQ